MRPQGNFFFLETRTTNLLWLGLLGLVVIFFFMLVFEAVSIESRLGEQVTEKLSQSGFKRTEVSVSGRDVMLEGAVSSTEARSRLVSIAQEVKGVRAVTSNLEIMPLRLSHIRLRRNQSGWQEVSGELASVADLENLRLQLGIEEQQERDGNSDFSVSQDAEVTESPWLQMVGATVEASAEIENLFLEIGAWHLVVGGTVNSEAKYAAAIALIEDLANENGLTLVNRLATINRLE